MARKAVEPRSDKDFEFVAQRIAASTAMIGTLVGPACDLTREDDIRIGLLQAWSTNYRLLAEFLMSPQKDGPTAQMFAPGWTAEGKFWRDGIGREYSFASTDVAHLWYPEWELVEASDVKTGAEMRANLKARAEFLLAVIDEFLSAVSGPREGNVDVMRIGVHLARRGLRRRPVEPR
jgi:hypothetical protein